MSADIQIIGDEIHFDRQLVAIMATGVSSTTMGDFCDALLADDPTPETDEVVTKPVSAHPIMVDAEKAARGGLLRLGDLATIIARHT